MVSSLALIPVDQPLGVDRITIANTVVSQASPVAVQHGSSSAATDLASLCSTLTLPQDKIKEVSVNGLTGGCDDARARPRAYPTSAHRHVTMDYNFMSPVLTNPIALCPSRPED